jgi:hypothetical protein
MSDNKKKKKKQKKKKRKPVLSPSKWVPTVFAVGVKHENDTKQIKETMEKRNLCWKDERKKKMRKIEFEEKEKRKKRKNGLSCASGSPF